MAGDAETQRHPLPVIGPLASPQQTRKRSTSLNVPGQPPLMGTFTTSPPLITRVTHWKTNLPPPPPPISFSSLRPLPEPLTDLDITPLPPSQPLKNVTNRPGNPTKKRRMTTNDIRSGPRTMIFRDIRPAPAPVTREIPAAAKAKSQRNALRKASRTIKSPKPKPHKLNFAGELVDIPPERTSSRVASQKAPAIPLNSAHQASDSRPKASPTPASAPPIVGVDCYGLPTTNPLLARQRIPYTSVRTFTPQPPTGRDATIQRQLLSPFTGPPFTVEGQWKHPYPDLGPNLNFLREHSSFHPELQPYLPTNNRSTAPHGLTKPPPTVPSYPLVREVKDDEETLLVVISVKKDSVAATFSTLTGREIAFPLAGGKDDWVERVGLLQKYLKWKETDEGKRSKPDCREWVAKVVKGEVFTGMEKL